MSAVYLHNSLYTQEVHDSRSNFPHSRNLSTISSVTLQTNTTLHSQPHEPLLPNSGTPKDSYYDILSHNTRPHSVPNATHQTRDNNVVESEKAAFSTLRRRPLNGMRWLELSLHSVIAIWALYNAIRYFLAFTIYESVTGGTVALALGICAGLSFAFLSCAVALYAFRPRLLCHGMSQSAISFAYWTLTYLALLFLFAPAAVNFAFIFVWRNASDLQLRPRHRCHVDIDLVWSKTHRMCKSNTVPWGVWVTLASLRIAFTFALLFGYQYTIRKIRRVQEFQGKRFRGRHRVNPSDLFSYQTALPPATDVPFPQTTPSLLLQSQQQQQSQSSISSRTRVSYRPRLARSRSSGLSAEARSISENLPITDLSQPPLPAVQEDEDFADRFTSLVSAIDRETEEALAFARSEETSSHHSLGSGQDDSSDSEEDLNHTQNRTTTRDDTYDDEDDFYSGVPRLPTIGFNEFGQPYPPEEDIPMMNGYIRRMPTIESMGSREMGSSIAGSSMFARGGDADKRGSMQTTKSHSRPPTRNRASWVGSEFSGSEPSSRTNSLSYQVEKLAAMGFLGSGQRNSSSGHGSGTSEMGELIVDSAAAARKPYYPESPSSTKVAFNLSVPEPYYSSSTGGTRSTNVSYFTATTGSAKTGTTMEEEDEKDVLPLPTSSGFSTLTVPTVPPKDV